ncbi:extracellular solute-binding protein [Amycolatopsis taiwanensis]|uniref:ABC transporter substrate-binding protein n=1 Tax=Amycolatopsis taiwanensis TaxID=342230 RepID=A0A9W6RCI0_9PSEU|nr:extracellular solute-binding protein [Amycolatopsis taiwanensis]GLY71567.1 ABC transporter substrate-binding protein [Amycolatopsis taiwanensis]
MNEPRPTGVRPGEHGGTSVRTGTRLRGITWDHPRGIAALSACAAQFHRETGIAVEWTARPLHVFEDAPIAEPAREYDLVALDHPFVGDAVAGGVLAPLDAYWDPVDIADRKGDSAGPSHASYHWKSRLWGGAVDAACMVSAYQDGRVDPVEVPRRWGAVEQFALRYGREAVLLAANPTHLWCTLLSLCEAVAAAAPDRSQKRQADGRPDWWRDTGIDPEVLAAALELAAALLRHCAPESLASDPITVLERLADRADTAIYSPLVFGYITYSRSRGRAAVVRFTDAPTVHGLDATVGTLAGGVGLSVSAESEFPGDAAEFVRYATSAPVQRGRYSTAGGQAGRRSVWTDDRINEQVADFYRGTVATMDRAFLRPRLPGYPAYQRAASHTLHTALTNGTPTGDIVSSLNRLWRNHVRV